jgi:nucleotide-binding universal stress UspA family protein
MIEYPKYKKVLFCTDFSENADHAFNFAYGVAKRDGGFLYILHVIPGNPQELLIEKLLPEDIKEAIQVVIKEDVDIKYKKHYVEKIRDAILFKVITKSGRADEEIIKCAQKEKVDLIVIGTHGGTGIERVFFGSVAEKVLRRSPIPVFLIPCRKKLDHSYDNP